MKAATKLEEEARMAFEEKERKMRERQKKLKAQLEKTARQKETGNFTFIEVTDSGGNVLKLIDSSIQMFYPKHDYNKTQPWTDSGSDSDADETRESKPVDPPKPPELPQRPGKKRKRAPKKSTDTPVKVAAVTDPATSIDKSLLKNPGG